MQIIHAVGIIFAEQQRDQTPGLIGQFVLLLHFAVLRDVIVFAENG